VNNIEQEDPLLVIFDLLEDSRKDGLESEVVYSALRYMKQQPDKSEIDAIIYGYYEWIK